MRIRPSTRHLRAHPVDWFSRRVGDFSTAEAAGRLSSTLFVLCGSLVLVAAAVLPAAGPSVDRVGLAIVGAIAAVSGVVIWNVPWHRWRRSSTLWLFVPALSLIAVHNVLTGADGYRYGLFYLVVFAWVGLSHPPGTALKLSPTLVISYLAPAWFTTAGLHTLVPGLVYTLPVCALIGESAAWVSERVRRSEQGMRLSEERFRSLVQFAADGITLVDGDGWITYDSPAVESMLGYPPGGRVGTVALDYMDPDDADGLRQAIAAMQPGAVARFEIRARHADGSWRWCDASLRSLLHVPAVSAIVVNLSDVTLRKAATEALAEREASFRSLFSSNPHPMWVYEQETFAFLEVNDAAVRHYGYSRAEFLARRVGDIRLPDPYEASDVPMASPVDGERAGSAQHRLADGRIIDVETITHQLEFRGRAAALVAVHDVTDRNALDLQLRHQAFHDSLTGLANRALFSDRIDHALKRRREPAAWVALLLIDLDGFKTINDSLGHAAGDELLIQVAERLKLAVRPTDTLARLGGDEFAVVIEDLDSPQAAELAAERILGALSAPFVVSGSELTIGASIGVAVPDLAATSPGVLLRNADVAMYQAKADGKGLYRLFQPVMHGAALERLELEADFRRALDDGQFELYYQPMFDLRAGRVVACEALIRWNHPRRGLLSPSRFITAAEESGFIGPLGRWILREACRELSRGLSVGISVNLSARQLADPGLVDEVISIVRRNGIDPGRLTLEITESVLMHNTSGAVECLRELRAVGVRLSIDDFGTGYSSLSYLRTFQVDELKIDKSFIDALPADAQGLSLVEGIIRLAGTLGLSTVAEGIETSAQQAVLSSLDCHLGQGFHLARPMPLAELRQYLALEGASMASRSAS